MPVEIDLARWPRRAAYEHFRRFDAPFFNVTARIDVTALKPALQRAVLPAGTGGVALALHHAALRVANGLPAWRRRLAGAAHDRVVEHAQIDASTTVLRADGSFGLAWLPWQADWAPFARRGAAALAAARTGDDAAGTKADIGTGIGIGIGIGAAASAEDADEAGNAQRPAAFDPRHEDDAVIHCTTLPWVHFTSFRHAMPGRPPPHADGSPGRPDVVPKLAFGRIDAGMLPLSVDLHHALADGIDAGRFIEGFQALMRAPQDWLGAGAGDGDGVGAGDGRGRGPGPGMREAG